MILILKENVSNGQIEALAARLRAQGFATNISAGATHTLIGLIGDTSRLDDDEMRAVEIVDAVKRISEPFKAVNRKLHPADTLISVGGAVIGEGHFTVMAGPCSVESEAQIISVAQAVKAAGARMLRGGAFKPRTSPYAFQGLHEDGIRLLVQAKRETGLPVVSEIMNVNHLDLFADVDVIQVGARNMQNFELLKALGRVDKPILLKRGLANTIEELLMSAEYVMAGGNSRVILCERGIRTFETATRNTLDVSMIPVIKRLSHLPVIVDPSHAAGVAAMVAPLSKAAVAAGADGLMIEVHNDPAHALCDGPQSLDPGAFAVLMADLQRRIAFEGKK